MTSAQCQLGGPLSVVSEWPTASGPTALWGFTRTDYRMRGARFNATDTRTIKGSQMVIDRLSRAAGIGEGHQFKRCALASMRGF